MKSSPWWLGRFVRYLRPTRPIETKDRKQRRDQWLVFVGKDASFKTWHGGFAWTYEVKADRTVIDPNAVTLLNENPGQPNYAGFKKTISEKDP